MLYEASYTERDGLFLSSNARFENPSGDIEPMSAPTRRDDIYTHTNIYT